MVVGLLILAAASGFVIGVLTGDSRRRRRSRRLCPEAACDNLSLAVDLPALIRWLEAAFDSGELRYIVRMGPEGEAITRFLPCDGCSLAQLCLTVAEAWRRHGLLHSRCWSRLRDHLLNARPSRSAEIKALFKKKCIFLREELRLEQST